MERRKFMRFDTKMDVEYRMRSNAEIDGITTSRNLSKEGVSIGVGRELEKGSELELKLKLPGDAIPIFAQGKVAWCQRTLADDNNNFNIGVSLTKIDSFDRGRLLEHAYNNWLKLMAKLA